MKKYRTLIILVNFLLLSSYMAYSVFNKEKLLKEGQLILLRLTPVDPRSIMQGDYMNLNYEIASNLNNTNPIKRGYIVVKLDSNGIATKVRTQTDKKPLNEKEYLISFTSKNKWQTNIGAESYFFEEGQGKKYEDAKYGALKIDQEGNSLLFGLFDQHKKLIK